MRQGASAPVLLAAGLILAACVPLESTRQPARTGAGRFTEEGLASWYGMEGGRVREHGKPTASGRPYDQNALTAAHKTLPLGTRVKVTNLENGRSLVVVINDRGPYIQGRIIDMTLRGARILGFKEKGTARVRIEALP